MSEKSSVQEDVNIQFDQYKQPQNYGNSMTDN